jgi:hypothetical protein|tara:strand:- start:873 stop:1034 length:162 start_codon:yes stop_codon:yes gene_type:complete
MNNNDKTMDKSLLGFVVDEPNKNNDVDNEKNNEQYLTTLLFELYPELNNSKKK